MPKVAAMKLLSRIEGTLTVLPLIALGLAFCAASAAAPPSAPDRVVFPTGNWPSDVENVQAAVDLGGIVLLKAHDVAGRPTPFNFGEVPVGDVDSDVCGKQAGLQGDVWLLGETAESAQTTIAGGYRSILIGLPTWCAGDYSEIAGHARVEAIAFDRSNQAAIDVYKAATAEIVDKT
jgi:hypothetical protein